MRTGNSLLMRLRMRRRGDLPGIPNVKRDMLVRGFGIVAQKLNVEFCKIDENDGGRAKRLARFFFLC